jgi:DNA-binding NtrC family response regulator
MGYKLPKILLMAGDYECGSLEESLHGLAEITIAQSIHETLHTLNSDDFDVLFCPWEIKGCRWSDFTGLLKNVHPSLPIVIYYHCGGEPEWTEVLEAGAFDLLAPPFERERLESLLENAVVFGQRQLSTPRRKELYGTASI